MTPPRRYLWRTARGSTYRAQGIPARQPDGRVVVTTDRETRIESVHLPADPLRYPAGWYLRVAGPHGDEWSVGPLVWGRNDPAPTTPPAITPPGCVEDFGTVVLADPDRYARHPNIASRTRVRRVPVYSPMRGTIHPCTDPGFDEGERGLICCECPLDAGRTSGPVSLGGGPSERHADPSGRAAFPGSLPRTPPSHGEHVTSRRPACPPPGA